MESFGYYTSTLSLCCPIKSLLIRNRVLDGNIMKFMSQNRTYFYSSGSCSQATLILLIIAAGDRSTMFHRVNRGPIEKKLDLILAAFLMQCEALRTMAYALTSLYA